MNDTKLRKAFADSLGIPQGSVVDSLAYQSVKQWDSIGHMTLVAALEREFDVMLDTDQIIALSSVGAAKSILQSLGVSFP